MVARQFPRLSHEQWERTVVDLFGLESPTGLSASFAADARGGRAFDNNQSALEVSPSLWSDYQSAAETLAETVTSDPTLLGRLLAELPSEPGAKIQAFLENFGLRVFRRPLLADELGARRELFAKGRSLYPELDPFVAGVRVCLASFLQSPYFLYRAELSQGSESAGLGSLSGWQIASRLSYAIWNSMPDQELFRVAQAGELATTEGVHAQVERMLDTPLARATLTRFFDQLFHGDQYPHLSKSSVLYPTFDRQVGADMRTELGKFAANVYAQGGGLRELLTSTTTFVTPRLATIYGLSAATLPPPDADGFSRVELDPAQRSGLLTLSGFLAWKGTDSLPNTIARGVFITRKVICQALGDPPVVAQSANFRDLPTNRERVDALTGTGTCGAGCHGTYINSAGFAFEHFGALGEYRTQDGGKPIDSSASFPFETGPVSYLDAPHFSRVLSDSPQVHACFSNHLFEYLMGREGVRGDEPLVAQLTQRSLAGASTRELLSTALESGAFQSALTTGEQP